MEGYIEIRETAPGRSLRKLISRRTGNGDPVAHRWASCVAISVEEARPEAEAADCEGATRRIWRVILIHFLIFPDYQLLIIQL